MHGSDYSTGEDEIKKVYLPHVVLISHEAQFFFYGPPPLELVMPPLPETALKALAEISDGHVHMYFLVCPDSASFTNLAYGFHSQANLNLLLYLFYC